MFLNQFQTLIHRLMFFSCYCFQLFNFWHSPLKLLNLLPLFLYHLLIHLKSRFLTLCLHFFSIQFLSQRRHLNLNSIIHLENYLICFITLSGHICNFGRHQIEFNFHFIQCSFQWSIFVRMFFEFAAEFWDCLF